MSSCSLDDPLVLIEDPLTCGPGTEKMEIKFIADITTSATNLSDQPFLCNMGTNGVDGESREITLELLGLDMDRTAYTIVNANQKTLLGTLGWNLSDRLARQSRLNQTGCATIHPYSLWVPQPHLKPIVMDTLNGNWHAPKRLELELIDDYHAIEKVANAQFNQMGNKSHIGYRKSRLKARLEKIGHLTGVPLENMYSRLLWLLRSLMELNGPGLWGALVGTSYLGSQTLQKMCLPPPTDAIIWMRTKPDESRHEHMEVYTKDLTMAQEDPTDLVHYIRTRSKSGDVWGVFVWGVPYLIPTHAEHVHERKPHKRTLKGFS
jgi:hypothetical protein